jgi:hypothetical protein
MSVLAAFILAAGVFLAAGVLCVPLHRLAEVLAELEIRTGARDVDVTVEHDAADWIPSQNVELLERIRAYQARITDGAS